MADGGFTLEIDPALAEKLQPGAKAAGESVESYARHVLEAIADRDAEWAEVDRIADETIAKGNGIPLDDVLEWMKTWGGPTKVAPPWR